MTRSEALYLLKKAEFRPFTEADWYSFAGCESNHPLICYDNYGFLIIMDGGSFTFYPHESLEEGTDEGVERFEI